MFCCAEMRCWRKMMCRCAAMEGESSQGELFAKLQASSPSQSSRAARCQLSQRESPWHDGKLSGSNAKCAVSPRGCFRRKPALQMPLSSTTLPVKMQCRTVRRLPGIVLIKIILPLNMARAKRKPLNGFAFRLQIGIQCSHLIGFAAEMAGHDLAAGQTDHVG